MKSDSFINLIQEVVNEIVDDSLEFSRNYKMFFLGTSSKLDLTPGDTVYPQTINEDINLISSLDFDFIFVTQSTKTANAFANQAVKKFGGKPVVYEVLPDVPIHWLDKGPKSIAKAPSARITRILSLGDIKYQNEEVIGSKGGVRFYQIGGSLPDKLYNRTNDGKPTRNPGVANLKPKKK